MKKKHLIIFCFVLIFTLSGCSGQSSRTNTDQKYIISAIGFDNESGKIKISAEAIIVNSENTDAEQKLEVLNGVGVTPQAALDDLGKSLAKPVILSHCGIIVVSTRLSDNQVKEIMDYCFKNKEITLSAYVVSAKSGAGLLSCKPISSIAVGYDVMGVIEQQSTRTGVNYKSRYYEVAAGRERNLSIFTLPFIKTEEDAFLIDGMTIYKNDKPVVKLDNEQAILYSILTDTYSKGKIFIKNDEYDIKHRKTDYNFSFDNSLKINIKIDFSMEKDDEDTRLKLEKLLKDFKEYINLGSQTDDFGFYNIIYREDRNIFNKIKNDYNNVYQNSDINITCEINGKSEK